MFTGIVEEVGEILTSSLDGMQGELAVRARTVIEDARLGDSIAVNGVCLTITSLGADRFTAGVMPETLRRTNLGRLQTGSAVNLERPVQPLSRMGGHFVQGHVDGVGTVSTVQPEGDALAVRIETDATILRYVVEKGFVAVDGASLTVTQIGDTGFGIALIPYSQENLAPGVRTVGSRVNLEVDVLAKYLEKLVVH